MSGVRLQLRPGAMPSFIAISTGLGVSAHLIVWADDGAGLVGLVAFFAVSVHLLGVVLGLGPAIGVAAVIAMGAGAINVAAADGPVWFEATISGVLIYGAAEAGWEALDRRSGSVRTGAALRYWLEQRAVVALATVLVATVAAATATSAPVRSVLLQTAVGVGFIGALVAAGRRLGRPSSLSAPSARHTDN